VPLHAGLGLVARLGPAAGAGEKILRPLAQPVERGVIVHHHHRMRDIDGVIGAEAEFAAGFQLGRNQVDRPLVHHPPLGMARLGPGIGVQQIDEAQCAVGHALEHVDGIAHVQPDVVQMLLAHMLQRADHAVEKRFRADETVIGQHVGAIGHMLARAEADLEMQRAIVAEQPARGDLAVFRHADLRQQLLDQLGLAQPQLVILLTAIKPPHRYGVSGFVRGHGQRA